MSLGTQELKRIKVSFEVSPAAEQIEHTLTVIGGRIY
jgi:hypothetical protein